MKKTLSVILCALMIVTVAILPISAKRKDGREDRKCIHQTALLLLDQSGKSEERKGH